MSNLMWRGHEEISGHFWGQIKCGAKIRNMDFKITREQVWNKFLKQNRKCALTGMELFFDRTDNTKITASLDRIDSSIGYLESNIQWVAQGDKLHEKQYERYEIWMLVQKK